MIYFIICINKWIDRSYNRAVIQSGELLLVRKREINYYWFWTCEILRNFAGKIFHFAIPECGYTYYAERAAGCIELLLRRRGSGLFRLFSLWIFRKETWQMNTGALCWTAYQNDRWYVEQSNSECDQRLAMAVAKARYGQFCRALKPVFHQNGEPVR